eukprot:CAMPEP_0179096370 /NCGR_PEP_ID=MMETSP0796-20121207/44300_1 /TAXON_ID=73915 /ORGANISM="Pyrodinium bahamense, Strain pbaha01" /LENGTH=156 /DNA_ID=CAMNT_0020794089 /DNA_START=204 /DNA_END=672 /DNA_ORIENTATION=-
MPKGGVLEKNANVHGGPSLPRGAPGGPAVARVAAGPLPSGARTAGKPMATDPEQLWSLRELPSELHLELRHLRDEVGHPVLRHLLRVPQECLHQALVLRHRVPDALPRCRERAEELRARFLHVRRLTLHGLASCCGWGGAATRLAAPAATALFVAR